MPCWGYPYPACSEAIDKHGSISKAAKHIPLSYKAAWDALEDLNNLADQPFIQRSIGGAGGGGTRLTDYGRKLIAMFRAIEGEYQAAMDRLYDEAAVSGGTDKATFQRLLRRITLRTSARNQFFGTVSRVISGAVDAQVFMTLDDDCELEAQVTADSVMRLELAPGLEVVALVKAPAVFLLTGQNERTADTNYLSGVVSRINKGTRQFRSRRGCPAFPCAPHYGGSGNAKHRRAGLENRISGHSCLSGVQRDPDHLRMMRHATAGGLGPGRLSARNGTKFTLAGRVLSARVPPSLFTFEYNGLQWRSGSPNRQQ